MHVDQRGRFVKTFHNKYFDENNLNTDFNEQYYSVSKQGVLRGMHFQVPPFAHSKLVYCVAGSILDVAVDLRKNSPTFLNHISIELSADKANMIYLPEGIAHGFFSLVDAVVMYNVSTTYRPEADSGVLWSSIGMDWPKPNPRVSERDKTFPKLKEFDSPFEFRSNQ